MCRVYNTIGSLITIQHHLINNNLDEFHSLNELINFQRDYHVIQQQIILNHTRLIEQEQTFLESDIANLNDIISTREHQIEQKLKQGLGKFDQQIEDLPLTNSKIIPILIDYYKNLVIWTKIWSARLIFHYNISFLERQSSRLLSVKHSRLNYILSNFQDAVNQSSIPELQEHQRKKRVVKEINNSIYGAFGEQKVVEELEKLSNDYILINDFNCSFDPPIHNRKENDYIRSVQIDHIVIAPSGIFIIETKNWSEHSMTNINLRSPVQQVIRSNYALFKILAGEVTASKLNLKKHHWGDRKIPLRNIIVFTITKPVEEFQFVKILTLAELPLYIKYSPPIFTLDDTQIIADFLLKISNQKRPITKLNI
jgi:hypothetical protein